MHRRFIILNLVALVCLIVLFPLRVAATALGDMRVFSTPVQALLTDAEIYAPGQDGALTGKRLPLRIPGQRLIRNYELRR